MRSAAGQVWCYQRAGGDARVDGCYSCGVGGHADATDALSDSEPFNTEFNAEATLRQALLRELSEELHASPQELDDLRLRGLIYDGLSPVDRVHLGVLYTARWCPAKPPQPPAGEALQGLGFMDLKTIIDEPRFELWSRLAVQHLITFP